MGTTPDPELWKKLSRELQVAEATLRAVAEVESRGSGFLPDGRPKVLFEGHAFFKLTGGRFIDHPNVCYPKWDPKKYRGPIGEWQRLDEACQLDRRAALQSASWGMFQLMGFNYSQCGFNDIETFVSAQYESIDKQIDSFARFVSAPKLLLSLQNRQWPAFAKAYNGPGYKKNSYDVKLANAYTRWTSALNGASSTSAIKPTTRKARQPSEQPGREEFEPTASYRPTEQRRVSNKKNVRPDAADLRDWDYRPNIAVAPPDSLLPNNPRPTKQQGDSSACTGFALSTVIEYLLDRGKRPVEVISPYMIYSMALRYDEWAGNEDGQSGSSLRGALKGWAKHGVSCARLWRTPPMPHATNEENSDWWLDAMKRPLGSYYRLSPECIRDIHIALFETGVVYASAAAHSNWDLLLCEQEAPMPTSKDEIPVIDYKRGNSQQGHAFAIVGYTRTGFVVQNSWGPKWGRGGFAILRYDDWVVNAMDCWVVQLGVVTDDHTEIAKAPSLRVDVAGRAVVSENPDLADHEITPFVIDMENEGRLSSKGRFRTSPDDLKALVDQHLKIASERWGSLQSGYIDVALYAHGGLDDEDRAAEIARDWIPHLYSRQIFPIFLMWETGALKTLTDIFEDAVKGEAPTVVGGPLSRLKQLAEDWYNERLEGLARLPGGKLWGQMKQNADALSGAVDSGIVQLFDLFKKSAAKDFLPPAIRLHLVGHSAGSIVHTWLGARALRKNLDVATISFLAPAVRLDVFNAQLGKAVAQRKTPLLFAFLSDSAERADDTCHPYLHSLLYLVSRSFEDSEETSILGMEKHLIPAIPSHDWGSLVKQLRSPGAVLRPGSKPTQARCHGGFSDDAAVRDAVADFIKSFPP